MSLPHLQILNAILYVAEQGGKWRGLPKSFGNWHTIYTRINRWAKRGVLDRVFVELQQRQIIQVRGEAVSLDSTAVKVHPDGTGAQKKTGRKPSGNPVPGGSPRLIWLPQMLERRCSGSLSPGDAPEGRELLKRTTLAATTSVIMDRAYEGDK